MSVRIRLTRVGKKSKPSYRVVVADQNAKRDGRFIELLGHYNPRVKPSQLLLDRDRVTYWLSKGAQPSATVAKLIKRVGKPA